MPFVKIENDEDLKKLEKVELRLRGCLLILRAVNCLAAFIVVVTLSNTPGVLALPARSSLDFPFDHPATPDVMTLASGRCYFFAMIEPTMWTEAKEKVEEMAESALGNNYINISISGSSLVGKKELTFNIFQGSTTKDLATCGISEEEIKKTRNDIIKNLVSKSLENKCLPNLWKKDECDCPGWEECPINGALAGDGAWLWVASGLTFYLWILKWIDLYFEMDRKYDHMSYWQKPLWEVFKQLFLSLTANQILGPLGSVGTIGKTHMMVVKLMPGWVIIMILATMISPFAGVLFILAGITLKKEDLDYSLRGALLWLVLILTCMASLCLLAVVVLFFFNSLPTFFVDLSFMFSIDFDLTFSVPAILVKWFLYVLSLGDTVTFAMKLVSLAKRGKNMAGTPSSPDASTIGQSHGGGDLRRVAQKGENCASPVTNFDKATTKKPDQV